MAPADFWRPIDPPCGFTSPHGAERQISRGKTRDLPSTYPSHIHSGLPNDCRVRCGPQPCPGTPCLVCASCSSGRKFASSFLQTPPHGDRPCCPAWSSRHQGLQRTFTSKSLPGSVSLAGSQTTCSMHVASRHARRTDRRAPARHSSSRKTDAAVTQDQQTTNCYTSKQMLTG